MNRVAFFAILLLAAQLPSAPVASATEQGAPSSRVLRQGKNIYKQSCAGCHKWHGDGGGGYGGAALSLRTTHLDQDQIMEVVRCGRPGTGMPQHTPKAYEEKCYGISIDDPDIEFPMKANTMLSPDEMAAVSAYVTNILQGKGTPSLTDCEDYWGPASHNCRDYRSGSSSDRTSNTPKEDH